MNALTKIDNTSLQAISEQELCEVLQTSLYPGAALSSIKMVLGYCKAAGLDPMQKPVHIVPMWDSKAKVMRDVIMPGVGLYRTQAARSQQLAGISEPEFGPEKQFEFGEFRFAAPEWCRVTVKRIVDGHERSFTALEYWVENYATAGKDTQAPNTMWKKRPRGQLAKCTQAQALRTAFPEMTGNQPTADEMEGKTIDMGADVVGTPTLPAPPPAPTHYPQDQFEKNLPSWLAVITSGRKTADQIIVMAETKHPLTDEQKARVRALPATTAEPDATKPIASQSVTADADGVIDEEFVRALS